jgi:hypothetical protein
LAVRLVLPRRAVPLVAAQAREWLDKDPAHRQPLARARQQGLVARAVRQAAPAVAPAGKAPRR